MVISHSPAKQIVLAADESSDVMLVRTGLNNDLRLSPEDTK
jgi:hypothetical protein